MANSDDYSFNLLRKVLKRERFRKLMIILLTFVAAFSFAAFCNYLNNDQLITMLGVIAFLTFLSGFIFLIQTLNFWRADSHPIVELLRYSPQQIVWVYSIHLEMMPAGIKFWNEYTISLHLMDRKEYQLRVNASELKILQGAFRNRLPHATFGYNQERAQWYTANPLLLYQDPKDMA